MNFLVQYETWDSKHSKTIERVAGVGHVRRSYNYRTISSFKASARGTYDGDDKEADGDDHGHCDVHDGSTVRESDEDTELDDTLQSESSSAM